MIPLAQRIVAILFSLSLLWVTIYLIRKRKLREEYALIWLAASIAILLFSVFGGLVDRLAAIFAVTYSPTLALVAGLLFAVVLLLSQSVMLSRQADNNRDLAQTVALLEYRLRELENDVHVADGEGERGIRPKTTSAKPSPVPSGD